MTNETNEIMWESFHFDFSHEQKNIEESNNEYDDGYDDEGEFQTLNLPSLMMTPFGPFRVDDTLNPFKHFKFWMGSTNFNITPTVRDVIAQIPGVEILQVLTRYKFIVGIGKLFNFRDVRVTIEQLLCGKHLTHSAISEIQTPEIQEQVLSLKDKLTKEHSKWAIYVFPNGKIDFAVDDDYDKKLKLYLEAQEVSNGLVITSEK